MTIDELWNNLKPIVDNLERKVDKLEPLVGKVEKLEPLVGKVDKLEPLVGKVDNLENEVKEIKSQVTEIQGNVQEIRKDIHKIETVNMTILITEQASVREELKEAERRINQKMDKYLEKNEVEHKKFEYEIANLEWKNKIAN